MEKSERIQLRITPDLKAKVAAAAEAENRTVSGYIVNLLIQATARKE